jgi:arylsulfatase
MPATMNLSRRPNRVDCRQLATPLVLVALCFFSFNTVSANDRSAQSRRPNIVIILADDLGFSDIGCYGGEIETPNLDRMFSEGMRFSQFYNCALCGPSRAALMTGQFPHRVGIHEWTGLLNDRCVTLFELLQEAGYQTAAVGRLDMTTADNWHEPANIARYVDRFLGSTGHTGPGHYFKAVRNCEFFRDGQPFPLPEDSYKTDLITDFAEEFIARAAEKQLPFFLYVAEYAPHWPLHAKSADMQRYRQRYRQTGWDAARQSRYERLVASGLIPPSSALSPRDFRVPAWSEATHQEWEADRMAAYAAQVDSLDQSVGRILLALKKAAVDQSTLVMFLSDNGASDQSAIRQLDRPGQTWRLDGKPTAVGNVPANAPGSADTFLTAGPGWSNLSNTPFRGHKNTNYEGGIAAPLLVSWPAVIRNVGLTSNELAHIVDVMATCLDVAGVAYPRRFHARQLQPLSGISLAPVFHGQSRNGHASLCWATSGCRAVREGDWKLVAGKDGPWELYDLSQDRTELDDLAAQYPERVQRMQALFRKWEKSLKQ